MKNRIFIKIIVLLFLVGVVAILSEDVSAVTPSDNHLVNSSTTFNGTVSCSDSAANGCIIINANNLVITCDNVVLIGSNISSSSAFYVGNFRNITINNCDSRGYHYNVRSASTSASNVVVNNGSWIQYRVGVDSSTQYGFYSSAYQNVTFSNVNIASIGTNAFLLHYAFYFPNTANAKNLLIENITLSNTKSLNIGVVTPYTSNKLDGLVIRNFWINRTGYYGILAGAMRNVLIENGFIGYADADCISPRGNNTLINNVTCDTAGHKLGADLINNNSNTEIFVYNVTVKNSYFTSSGTNIQGTKNWTSTGYTSTYPNNGDCTQAVRGAIDLEYYNNRYINIEDYDTTSTASRGFCIDLDISRNIYIHNETFINVSGAPLLINGGRNITYELNYNCPSNRTRYPYDIIAGGSQANTSTTTTLYLKNNSVCASAGNLTYFFNLNNRTNVSVWQNSSYILKTDTASGRGAWVTVYGTGDFDDIKNTTGGVLFSNISATTGQTFFMTNSKTYYVTANEVSGGGAPASANGTPTYSFVSPVAGTYYNSSHILQLEFIVSSLEGLSNISLLHNDTEQFNVYDDRIIFLHHFDNNSGIGETSGVFRSEAIKAFNSTCSGARCPTLILTGTGYRAYFNGSQNLSFGRSWELQFDGVNSKTLCKTINSSNYQALMNIWGFYAGGAPEVKEYTSGNHLLFRTRNSTTTQSTTGTITLQNNTEYRTCVVYNHDINKQIIYVNGVYDTNSTLAVGNLTSNSDFTLGMYPEGTNPYTGSIDDFVIYNYALSLSEIVYDNKTHGNDVRRINSTSYSYNYTYGALVNGTWNYLVTATNSNGTSNSSGTYYVGLTEPSPPPDYSLVLSFGANTDLDGINLTRNYIMVNSTVTGAGFSNQTIYFYNATGLQASNYSSTNITFINFTDLVEGNYSYYVAAYDLNGILYTSEYQYIEIDSTIPVVSVFSPSAIVYSNSSILINFSATDAGVGLDKLWFNNGSGNTTYTTEYTLNLSDATWNFTFYANDTLNNIGNVSVLFTVDSTPPVINWTGFVDGLFSSQFSVFLNASISLGSSTLSSVNLSLNGTQYSLFDDSLVLWLPMQNVSSNSTFTKDYSAYGNNGTVNGTTYNSTDGSYYLNDNYLYSNISINTKNVTFVLNIKDYEASDGYFGGNTVNDLFIDKRNTYAMRICYGSSICPTTGNNLLSLNTWVHVVIVIDNNVSFYKNGVLFYQTSRNISKNVSNGGVIVFGRRSLLPASPGVYTFNGSIDDVLIFNRSLSASEVAVLYSLGRSGFVPTDFAGSNYELSFNRSFGVGSSNYSLFVTDSFGLSAQSATYNVTVYDLTAPTFTTPSDSGIISRNYVHVNVSVNGFGFSNVTTYLYNVSGGLVASNFSASNSTFINFTGLSDGNYTYNATAYDLAGTVYAGASVVFVVDTTPPSLTVSSPVSDSIILSNNISINVSVSDVNMKNTTFKVYNSSGGLVNTVSNFSSIYGSVIIVNVSVDGVYSINITSYDLSDNSVSSLITNITTHISAPSISLVSINPSAASESSVLNCTGSFSGVLSETNSSWRWFVNAVLVPGQNARLLSGVFSYGNFVVCEYTPGDEYIIGSAVNSSAVVILPSGGGATTSGGGGGGGGIFCPAGQEYNGTDCVSSSVDTSSWRVDTDLKSSSVHLRSTTVKTFLLSYYSNNVLTNAKTVNAKIISNGVEYKVDLVHESLGVYRFTYDFIGWHPGKVDLVVLFDGRPKTLSLILDNNAVLINSVKDLVNNGIESVDNNRNKVTIIVIASIVLILLIISGTYYFTRSNRKKVLKQGAE